MSGPSDTFAANRCSGFRGGKCVHGFPWTRFCAGSLNPVRMFKAATPKCCDEDWPYALAAAARQGGDVKQAPAESPQSGGEAVTPNPSHIPLMNKDEAK